MTRRKRLTAALSRNCGHWLSRSKAHQSQTFMAMGLEPLEGRVLCSATLLEDPTPSTAVWVKNASDLEDLRHSGDETSFVIVEGDAIVVSDLDITGTLIVRGTVTVEGDINVDGTVRIEGDVLGEGDVNVKGTVLVEGMIGLLDLAATVIVTESMKVRSHGYVAGYVNGDLSTGVGVTDFHMRAVCACASSRAFNSGDGVLRDSSANIRIDWNGVPASITMSGRVFGNNLRDEGVSVWGNISDRSFHDNLQSDGMAFGLNSLSDRFQVRLEFPGTKSTGQLPSVELVDEVDTRISHASVAYHSVRGFEYRENQVAVRPDARVDRPAVAKSLVSLASRHPSPRPSSGFRLRLSFGPISTRVHGSPSIGLTVWPQFDSDGETLMSKGQIIYRSGGHNPQRTSPTGLEAVETDRHLARTADSKSADDGSTHRVVDVPFKAIDRVPSTITDLKIEKTIENTGDKQASEENTHYQGDVFLASPPITLKPSDEYREGW